MNLKALKSLLVGHPRHQLRLRLPDSPDTPVPLHITEVGRIDGSAPDGGGSPRQQASCQLRVRISDDCEPRISDDCEPRSETESMAAILQQGRGLLADESVTLEIECGDRRIPPCTIEGHQLDDDTVTLLLAYKQPGGLDQQPPPPLSLDQLRALGTDSNCCSAEGC